MREHSFLAAHLLLLPSSQCAGLPQALSARCLPLLPPCSVPAVRLTSFVLSPNPIHHPPPSLSLSGAGREAQSDDEPNGRDATAGDGFRSGRQGIGRTGKKKEMVGALTRRCCSAVSLVLDDLITGKRMSQRKECRLSFMNSRAV